CNSFELSSFFPMLMFCVLFGRRPLTQAGFQKLNQVSGLAFESFNDLTGGHRADDRDAGGFNCLPASLFAVNGCENSWYLSVLGACCLKGTKRRATGRDHVF